MSEDAAAPGDGAEGEAEDGDAAVCEWCGVLVPEGAWGYAPFCCLGCRREAHAADLWRRREEERDGLDRA